MHKLWMKQGTRKTVMGSVNWKMSSAMVLALPRLLSQMKRHLENSWRMEWEMERNTGKKLVTGLDVDDVDGTNNDDDGWMVKLTETIQILVM